MTAVKDAARAWIDAGASVLPAIRGKRPVVSWTEYQQSAAPFDRFDYNLADGLGIVTGYNGYEMFEVEGDAVRCGMVQELVAKLSAANPGIMPKMMGYCEQTPSGGFHWIYRTEGEQEGSTKLARSTSGKTLIETRGKYGWTVIAPSGGTIHEEVPGGEWRMVSGSPGVVPIMSEEEVATLYDCARELDQMPAVDPVEHRPSLPAGDDLAPGQDFEQRSEWADILQADGWRPHPNGWIRPGKRFGLSATITPANNLYVWSTSCAPLEPSYEAGSYTKFRYLSLTKHGGDDSAAARELRRTGYGTVSEPFRLLRLVPTTSTPPDGDRPSQGSSGPGMALPAAVIVAPPVVYTLTDDGNAKLIVERSSGEYLYSPERKSWLHWTGIRWEWQPDDGPMYMVARELFGGWHPANPAEQKHKHYSLSTKGIGQAVKQVSADPEMRISPDELDAHAYLINTPNGVLDLLNAELGPHDALGHHTRLTGCSVDFHAECPLWIKFLTETFMSDWELIKFVQKLAGYSATGKVTHHLLPFLHGVGANGKSVFLEVMQGVLGDYAGTAPADFLLANGREDSDSVARLAGQRLVVCSEVPPTAHFHEQRVKMLTGGDRITARRLYERNFTFTPTHHLWLSGNHQPKVTAGGSSFWRRLRLIPFLHEVPEAEAIADLADQLLAKEGPAILAWLARGAKAQLEGLQAPTSVQAATAGYAEEEDALGRFMAERVHRGGGSLVIVNTKVMYQAYLSWCGHEGIRSPMPNNVFGREIKTRGVESTKRNGVRYYMNVTLLNGEEEPDSERHWQDRLT